MFVILQDNCESEETFSVEDYYQAAQQVYEYTTKKAMVSFNLKFILDLLKKHFIFLCIIFLIFYRFLYEMIRHLE